MTTLTATFFDRSAAEDAINELLAAGVEREDISMVMSNATRDRYFNSLGDEGEPPTKIVKGAAGGGAVGGSIGAIAGGFLIGGAVTVATGGLAAPLLIAGPIAGALAGGGAGAAVGSVVGALIGAGLPEHEAGAKESDILNGAIVLAVRSRAGESDVRSILERDGTGVASAKPAGAARA